MPNTDDFEVLHHYLNNTSKTLGHVVWEDNVPVLAFRHPVVLHLLLALSALHLARLGGLRRVRFQELAEGYFAAGLRQVIPLVSNLNPTNCDTLFISSILLCFIHLAKDPDPGQRLQVGNYGLLTWWNLLRGVRLVTTTMGLDTIFSGVLGPRVDDGPPPKSPFVQPSLQTPRWEQSLKLVSTLASQTACPETDMYRDAVDILSTCFLCIYGHSNEPKVDETTDEALILAWMDDISDEFVRCMKNRQTVALLILAHYAVLLKKLQFLWYMRGWGDRILVDVTGTLDKGYKNWLHWPRQEISRLERRRISTSTD